MAEPEIGEARSKVGRPPLPSGLRRDKAFRVSFAAHDAADIREVAAGWGVPPGVALWAIILEQLAKWRRIAPEYGQHGLVIAGALQVLRQKWAEERAEAHSESSDAG